MERRLRAGEGVRQIGAETGVSKETVSRIAAEMGIKFGGPGSRPRAGGRGVAVPGPREPRIELGLTPIQTGDPIGETIEAFEKRVGEIDTELASLGPRVEVLQAEAAQLRKATEALYEVFHTKPSSGASGTIHPAERKGHWGDGEVYHPTYGGGAAKRTTTTWWIRYYADGKRIAENAHTRDEGVARALVQSRGLTRSIGPNLRQRIAERNSSGRVAERIKAPVLKTDEGKPSAGSNPAPSAKISGNGGAPPPEKRASTAGGVEAGASSSVTLSASIAREISSSMTARVKPPIQPARPRPKPAAPQLSASLPEGSRLKWSDKQNKMVMTAPDGTEFAPDPGHGPKEANNWKPHFDGLRNA